MVVTGPHGTRPRRMRRTATHLSRCLARVPLLFLLSGLLESRWLVFWKLYPRRKRIDRITARLRLAASAGPRVPGGWRIYKTRFLGYLRRRRAPAGPPSPSGTIRPCHDIAMSAFLQGSGLSAEEAADLGDDHVSVTKISPAVLNLQRVYEQNRQRLEQIESGIMPDTAAQQPQAGKGAPRLLLMGQRRYVIFLVRQFARAR